MNKMKKGLMILLLVLVGFSLASCDSDEYTAASEFYYSIDAGKTYGNRTKEFNVGDTVYLLLKAQASTTGKGTEEVTITLTIPHITAVDAKYYDGEPITPVVDDINNITTYTFTILASQNPSEWEYVFQFVPNSAGEITIKLEFGSQIPQNYNKQNTVKFVEPKTEED